MFATRVKSSVVSGLGIALLIVCLGFSAADAQNPYLQNNELLLEFDGNNGALIAIEDTREGKNILNEDASDGSIWEIFFTSSTDKPVGIHSASDFSFTKPDSSTLILKWANFAGEDRKSLEVTAEIAIEDNDSMSRWKISVEGIKGNTIHEVAFPKVKGIKDFGNERLAVPVWMGQLMEDPRQHLASRSSNDRRYEWSYPGGLSMQFLALYNPEEMGLYAATNDSLSYRKGFSVSLDSSDNLTYAVKNYPAVDAAINSYSPEYEALIGLFEGDWITAAIRYREWGSRQSWSRNSRLKNGLTPDWLQNTALWVWNREESEKVLTPATELKEQLGLPVSVLWHWWHDGQYDVSFPEYFPPREGSRSFKSAVASAKNNGVNPIIYMNQLQWGTSTKSFKEEDASTYAVKDFNGEMISHAYNIFTGKSLTNMCIATPFWKDKYTGLAEEAIDTYGVSGIYMDQACLSRMCYDKSHNHSIGGGNYWVENSTRLTDRIRSAVPNGKEIILAGEGGLESYLPYLDVFLTLQVSRERYAGIGAWSTIPMFQAVYHEYGVTFGSYSSLLSPPYDDTWPKEYAPEDELSLLDESFNEQFLMEQARSFVWGMQPTIANYQSHLESSRQPEIEYLKKIARVRQKGRKYFLHGKFVRTPGLEIPGKEIEISRLSIYAGRGDNRVTTSSGRFPTVYAGSWQSTNDKSMAIAFASITGDPFSVDLNFNSSEYQLGSSGEIYIVDETSRRYLASYSGGKIRLEFELPPEGINYVEIIPDSVSN